jgi:hypothetical protein
LVAATLALLLPIHATAAQALAGAAILNDLKRYADSRRKLIERQQKQAEQDYRRLGKEAPEVRQLIQKLVDRRRYLADSQLVVFKQLTGMAKGEPEWKAGPYVPLSRASLADLATGHRASRLRAEVERTEAAGRMVLAQSQGAAEEGRARRREVDEYQRLLEAHGVAEETLDHVLGAIGLPPAAVLYERRLEAQARSDARLRAQQAERDRRAEIGSALWLSLGALWLAGTAVGAAVVEEKIADFKRRCKELGGTVYDGLNPLNERERLIECR